MEFSFSCAKRLAKEPNSPFALVKQCRHFTLPWRFQTRESDGVKMVLNSMLMLFDSQLKGIPVAYSKIKHIEDKQLIVDEEPEMHLDLQIEFVVFRPHIGQKLLGVVTETINDRRVSCLVQDSFNADILVPTGVRNERLLQRAKSSSGRERRSSNPESETEGTTIEFEVTSMEAHNRIFSIRGKYIAKVGQESVAQNQVSPRKKRVKTEIVPVLPDLIQSTTLFDSGQKKRIKTEPVEEVVKERKHKKRKVKEEVD